MTLNQSALLELTDVLRTADGGKVMRLMLSAMLQALVDAEATAAIGANPYEHTPSRTTQRNGTREKTVSTTAGDLMVKIPKLRAGSFFPSLLAPRRRIDVALYAVVMEAYVHGVSTRKVDDLVAALGVDAGISKSEVSRICADLDADVALFQGRELDEQAFPYVFVDATYCKARVAGRVVSQAVVIATGVSADGRREVLGSAVGDSETEDFWTEFLRGLRERGLHGVQLVISDHHRGLMNAIDAVMVGASWQRCRVHFMRNVLAKVGGPRWVIYDEAWRLLRQPALLARMQSQWKLSRGLGIANLMIIHRLSDLEAVGNADSEARALALGLLADCSTKIIYQQESSEAPRTAEVLGLSVTERGELPDLQRGEGLWRVGQRAFVVRHLVTDGELQLFDTNFRMFDVSR